MKIQIHPTAPKYVNQKGNTVFRYLVKGSEEELKAYKEAKGDKFRTDDGTKEPLFFTTRYAGKQAELRKTSDGKDYVIDDTEITMFQSLVSQYGIDTAKMLWEKDNKRVQEPSEIGGQKQ